MNPWVVNARPNLKAFVGCVLRQDGEGCPYHLRGQYTIAGTNQAGGDTQGYKVWR